jgi:hypothetical protein
MKYKLRFLATGIEIPPKCVNQELNSQLGIRGQVSQIELSVGSPYIRAHVGCCIIVMQYDSYALNKTEAAIYGTSA